MSEQNCDDLFDETEDWDICLRCGKEPAYEDGLCWNCLDVYTSPYPMTHNTKRASPEARCSTHRKPKEAP